MALQFRPPIAPKPAPRTGSVCIVEHGDDLYDDIIHARQSTQKVPPPVAAKPKQLVPSVTEQKNTPSHNDVTKETTKSSQKVSTLVATRSKQNMAPVTKQRMSSSSTTEEVTIRCSQKVPPPISPKPKQHVSPLTEQGNSPLYDNIASITTKQKAPPQVLALRQTTQRTRSPVTEQQAHVQSIVSPIQVAADFNTAEEENIPIYDDATSVIQDMPTPTQKFSPQLTPPFTAHRDVHAPIYIVSSVTLPRVAQRPSHQGITSSKKNMNTCTTVPGSCKMAALMSLTFPCLVQISSGCCGRKDYPMGSLSKGEELLIFFTKRATVVPAYKPGKSAEMYRIPMCSTFQFGLISDQPNGAETENYNFDNITDILSQTRELPKVIKVLKSCVGKTEESSVSGGTLIFPKRVITHTDKKGKEKMELVCANDSNDKTLILKLPCIGNFSTHPSDVKMSILQYISHINVFPVTLQVFNYNKILCGESHIDPGTEFVLNNPTEVKSYICSKDIFGEKNYPLLEVPVEAPVTVLCKEEHDGVNMMSVHDVAKVLYDNFNLSKIKNYVPFCEESSYEIQDELYKEITPNVTKEYYELTSPVNEHDYEYIDTEVKQHKTTNLPSPLLSPQKPPKKSCFPPSCNTLPKQTSQDHPLRTIQPQKKNLSMPREPQLTEERNKAYLQSLSRRDVLQLLDNMNLSQYKESFKEEQIDGTILAALSGDDLKELGVTKGVQIKRLLRLINGTMSAKDVLENEHSNKDQIYY